MVGTNIQTEIFFFYKIAACLTLIFDFLIFFRLLQVVTKNYFDSILFCRPSDC